MKRLDIAGHVYGRWTVIEYSHSGNQKKSWWKVKCQCGTESVVRAASLRSGASKGCGCLKGKSRALRCRSIADEVGRTGLKACSNKSCQETNPQKVSNFRSRASSISGLNSQCKTCDQEAKLRRIGTSVNQKRNALLLQKGKCANPRCDSVGNYADHNHDTGRFRAVLCNGCNVSEGLLSSQKRIIGLWEYRQQHDRVDYPNSYLNLVNPFFQFR